MSVKAVQEWDLLNQIKEAYQKILGPKLTGIYVHGSIAFGCFRWEKSDIDFLVVAEEPLEQPEKEKLIQTLLDLDAQAPQKGFEMSVVLHSACSPFSDPTPFELHYSNAHRENYQRALTDTCRRMQGYDPDLAAHMTVVRSTGIVLCGAPIEAVFTPVPRESFLRSIWYDIASAPEEIENDPVYYVLNLCRVLACAEEGLVLSKEQGGEWGMAHLKGESALIQSALAAYRGENEMQAGKHLRTFAENVLLRIRQKYDFLNVCPKNN